MPKTFRPGSRATARAIAAPVPADAPRISAHRWRGSSRSGSLPGIVVLPPEAGAALRPACVVNGPLHRMRHTPVNAPDRLLIVEPNVAVVEWVDRLADQLREPDGERRGERVRPQRTDPEPEG